MVTVDNPDAYTLKGFRPSQSKGKKIDAILQNKETGKAKIVPFGQKGSATYQNKTGVALSSPDSIHSNPQLRKAYRARHAKTAVNKYSSSWFAYHFLW